MKHATLLTGRAARNRALEVFANIRKATSHSKKYWNLEKKSPEKSGDTNEAAFQFCREEMWKESERIKSKKKSKQTSDKMNKNKEEIEEEENDENELSESDVVTDGDGNTNNNDGGDKDADECKEAPNSKGKKGEEGNNIDDEVTTVMPPNYIFVGSPLEKQISNFSLGNKKCLFYELLKY